MQVNHSSIELYVRILQSMQADLCKVDQEAPDGDLYRKAVQVIASGIRELRKLTASGFANWEEEIALFREACIFDTLSLVLDDQFAAIASHIDVCGLGYERYFEFLQRQKREGGQRADKTKGWKFEWKESRSAAVERIKAEALNESVYVNGAPATTAQLVAKFEEDYGVDLRDFNKLLYAADARKKDATPYLTKLINAFKGRKVMLRK